MTRFHQWTCLAHVWLASCVVSVDALAQSHWELTPYRIRVIVAVASVPELDETMKATVMAELGAAADAVLGAAWDLNVQEAAAELRYHIVHQAESLPDDLFAADWDQLDKVIVIGIDTIPGGFRVVARDFDCMTRMWSPPAARAVQQTSMLPSAVFRILLETFAPVARIEFEKQQQAILRPRAAGLPLRDASFHLIEAGDLFVPVLRRNDRAGNPRTGGIQAVPWTFVTVDEVGPSGALCSVSSGLRRPLRTRVRGRIEQLALAVKAAPAPTRLLLRDRAERDRPLVGYRVYARDPGTTTTEQLGQTDQTGALTIEPGSGPLRILYVRNGTPLLARLPVVPGWEPVVTAHIADDNVRLRAEGFLAGLQDSLLDLVARREILIARIRRQLEEGDLDAAQKRLDELQRLPNRQRYRQLIAQERPQDVSRDPQVAARIEQLFDSAERLLVEHLDSRKINEIQSEYDRAWRQRGRGG